MRKILLAFSLLVSLLFFAPSKSSAQFENGHSYLGVDMSFGTYVGSGSLILGANFEAPITQAGTAGPGMFSLAPRVDFLFATGGPYVGAAILANYNFRLDDPKWDPFIGIGASFAFSPFTGFVAFNAGTRYFLNSGLAIRALFGSLWGGLIFSVGLDWTL